MLRGGVMRTASSNPMVRIFEKIESHWVPPHDTHLRGARRRLVETYQVAISVLRSAWELRVGFFTLESSGRPATHNADQVFFGGQMRGWRYGMRKMCLIVAALLMLTLTGCGYNRLQAQDEQIKASWSEVVNQYQRRADLVPNLVNTVKGYAQQERDVFMQVTEARARVGSIQVTPEVLENPEEFAKFQSAQGQLSSSLSRLLAVSENYPQLKSDANFRDLQAQLEGTENRIAVARNRYIQAVREYNTSVRSFPSNLTASAFGFKAKPNFSVTNEAEIAKPPPVEFGKQPGGRQPAATGATN